MKKGMKEVFDNYKTLIKDAVMELKTKGKRHRQIPNLLTATRLIAAPCFIIPAAIVGSVPLIITFTAIFSLTDLLDGYIARKYHLTSELGKDLDAICDKIFAASLLLAASIANPILLFNLGLEGVIAAVNTHQKITGKKPSSLYVGKIKTWALFGLIGAGIVSPYLEIPGLFTALLAASTSMQMLTIASYILKYDRDNTKKMSTNVENSLTSESETITEPEEQLEKVKSLEPTTIGATESRLNPKQELIELREILVHEKAIREPKAKEQGYQKVNNKESN